MRSTTEAEPGVVERLERAATRLSEAEDRVAAVGEEDLRAVAAAHEEFERLLDRYVGSATGTGDFGAFVEFEEAVSDLVDGLDDDLPERDAFEAAEDHLDKRRVSEADFERARELLAPARRAAERLDERTDARRSYRQARRAVVAERRDVDERVDDLERVRRLGEADLEAPVERLREPIEAYDAAVAAAFDEYVHEASARETLALVARTRWYPLVDFRPPPTPLREYVETHDAGTEPVTDLLEYAGYSRSKLSHYVDDADALKRSVATEQTYLERLDAGPLTVGWPPPPAADLRVRTREYEAVVHRFAGEDVVAALRTVRRLPETTDYERLRTAAVAAAELSDDERALVASGGVEDELAALRERRERLAAALEDQPAV